MYYVFSVIGSAYHDPRWPPLKAALNQTMAEHGHESAVEIRQDLRDVDIQIHRGPPVEVPPFPNVTPIGRLRPNDSFEFQISPLTGSEVEYLVSAPVLGNRAVQSAD